MIDIKIYDRDLVTAEAEQFVTNDESGGIVIFVGTVRKFTKGKEVVRLEFEAYKPMAIKEMTKIAAHSKLIFLLVELLFIIELVFYLLAE